jgi:hypothetical protein
LAGLFRQVAVELDPAIVLFLVGNGLWIKPIDDGVLDGISEEVIAGWAVMADEVTLYVLVEGNAEALVVFDVHQVFGKNFYS